MSLTMKISHKLILGFLLVALLASLTALTALRSYRNIDAAFTRLIQDPVPTIKSLQELRKAGTRIVSSTSELSSIYSEIESAKGTSAENEKEALEDELQLMDRGYVQFDWAVARYEQSLDLTSPKELEFLENIKSIETELKSTSSAIIEAKKKGETGKKMLDLREKFEAEEMAFLQANDSALANEYGQMNDEQTNVQQSILYSTRATYIVTFLTFLLATGSGLFISRLFSNRIVKLKEASEKIGSGILDTVADTESTDEIGDLGRSFNKMVRDLKSSNTNLAAARNFTDKILNSMVEFVVVVDMDLVITQVNEAAVKMSGYAEAELIGKPIDQLIQGEPLNQHVIDALHSHGSIANLDRSELNKDGSLTQITVSLSLLRDADGNGRGIVCVGKDVSQRKRMEAESRLISEVIRGVSETSNLSEFLQHTYNSISKLLYSENCFVALYNPKTEMLNMELFVDKFDNTCPPHKMGKGLTSYVYRSGDPLLATPFEIERLVNSAEIALIGTKPAVWMGVPLKTPAGVLGVLAMQHYEDENAYGPRDLELLTSVGDQIAIAIERRRAEEAVQTSRDYLNQIINAVADPIFVKDRLHQWVLVNDSFTEFIGHSREELISRSDYDFFPDSEADVFWEKDEIVFACGTENINEEEITDASGKTRNIVTRKRLYTDSEGEQYIVAVINDVTARKGAEKVLQENIRSTEESLALLDTILATAPIGFAFYKDRELIYDRINETLAAINGLPVEDHLGKAFRDVVPEMAVPLEPLLHKVFDTGEAVIDFEVTGKTAADPGHDRHWLTNFYPVRTEAGVTLGVGALIQDVTERKRIETELQGSKDYLDRIINTVADPIFVADSQSRLKLVNDAFCEMLNGEKSEILGKTPYDFFPPEEARKIREMNEAAIASGLGSSNEDRVRDDNGDLKVMFTKRAIYEDQNGERFIVGMINDLTEREKAEEDLRRSEARFQLVGRATNDVIWDWDIATNGLWWNENLYSVFAYSKGQTRTELAWWVSNIHPDDAAAIDKSIHEFLSGDDEVWRGEYRYKRGDGTYAQVVDHGIVLRGADRKPVQMVGSMTDITESKRAEEFLRDSEAKFRDLFDNAPVAYHELDVNGCFMRVNHTEELLLGYTEDELHGRHASEIILEKVSRAAIEEKLAGRAPLVAVERTFVRKDGTNVSVLNEDRLIFDSDGCIIGIRTTLQDITERKILEDKLQRAQKLESIGQLAAGIAHEINTPTQYVGDNVRFLKNSFEDFVSVLEKSSRMAELCRSNNLLPEFVPQMEKAIEDADVDYLVEEVPNAFKQALDGVERIRKIVQSMKDFAHPGSTDMKSTDLNKAIESTVTVASNEWKYVANVVTNYDENLPPVPCLAGEFNQVVLNMIVNAAHAISDTVGDGSNGKGTINITTRRVGDFAEIRISDTGTGIPEDIRQKIFDPFFTTKEVGKGTGQGLAISHTVIVEKHKGTIDVESEVGKGTTFVICLPVNESADAAGL